MSVDAIACGVPGFNELTSVEGDNMVSDFCVVPIELVLFGVYF